MSRAPITEPTITEHGDEAHPSFGVARLSRVTSTPAARLFDSSIPHSEYVSMEIARATRRRDLNRDWIYSSPSPLISVDMTMTQWGSMVSSFGQGGGTPVTLRWVGKEQMPSAAHESRLAETAREVQSTAAEATEQARAATAAVVAGFESKLGRRDMADLINTLHHTMENLPKNMKFAADSLTRHAEDVVSKARADIEAARQFGTQPAIAAAPVPEVEA